MSRKETKDKVKHNWYYVVTWLIVGKHTKKSNQQGHKTENGYENLKLVNKSIENKMNNLEHK